MKKFSEDYSFWVAEMCGCDDLLGKPVSISAFFWQNGKVSKKVNFLLDSKDYGNFSSVSELDLPSFLEISKACQDLKKKCEGFPLFVVADFGLSEFLKENDFIDFLWLSRAIFPFLNSHTLLSLAQRFELAEKIVKRNRNYPRNLAGLIVATIDYVQEKFTPDLCRLLADVGKDARVAGADFFGEMSDFLVSQSILSGSSLRKYQKDVNFFEHFVEKEDFVKLDAFFKKGGSLSKKFATYQARKPQVQMSKNVLSAFEKKQILLAEAGTGTGKSLAYLVPSLLYARSSGKQVVVSTNTINLQKQLMKKDVPLLVGSLPINFQVALLKGRGNYLCLQKFNQLKNDQLELGLNQLKQFFLILPWAWFTATGDISYHSGFGTNLGLWSRICSEPNSCLKRKCSFFRDCFLYKARAQASKSDVAIINHSLLLTELLAQMPTLSQAECVVVDEAHNLHSVALEYLGPQVSYTQISKFLDSIHNSKNRFQKGFLALLKSKLAVSKIPAADKKSFDKSSENLVEIVKNSDSVQNLFKEFFSFFEERSSYGKLRLKKKICETEIGIVAGELQKLQANLGVLGSLLEQQESGLIADYDVLSDNLKEIRRNAQEYLEFFVTLQNPDFDNYCLWMSGRENFYSLSINYTPIEIGEKLKEIFYDKIDSLVFCSATIALRGKFKFFESRMGLDLLEGQKEVVKQTVESPFDYKRQSKVFVPKGLEQPGTELGREQILQSILSVLQKNEVGSLILFTSLFDVKKARDFLQAKLKNRLILSQDGSKSRESLLEEFAKVKTSVLLATSSFWEGVDVSGDALQLLILYKLPFVVPSDPLVEAVSEFLQKHNKNPFMHYMLPTALLKYKQGFGRLIRSQEDHGVLVSYDNRIFTKKYGEFFKQILPATTEIIDHKELPTKVGEILQELAK